MNAWILFFNNQDNDGYRNNVHGIYDSIETIVAYFIGKKWDVATTRESDDKYHIVVTVKDNMGTVAIKYLAQRHVMNKPF